jgi:hypothetical protein
MGLLTRLLLRGERHPHSKAGLVAAVLLEWGLELSLVVVVNLWSHITVTTECEAKASSTRWDIRVSCVCISSIHPTIHLLIYLFMSVPLCYHSRQTFARNFNGLRSAAAPAAAQLAQ